MFFRMELWFSTTVKKSHEGSYICRASNPLTTIEAKVKINSPVMATSCSVIKRYARSVSGNYVIDPDGEGGLAPFTVFCDMIDKSGVGVTVIGHDSDSRTHVCGCENPGCYSRDIHYTVCLSWRVSPESLHNVSSLSSTSVIIRFCDHTGLAHTDGGCHAILRR